MRTGISWTDTRAQIWIRPEDIHHQIMIMVRTEEPLEAQAWDRGLGAATKNWSGFRQINAPNCKLFCADHWTCPGMYGWELFGRHNVPVEIIMEILKLAQEIAVKYIADW